MALERESLPELTKAAEKLSAAISQVETTSTNLGGEAGPARFNYTSVTGVERIQRVVEVGKIRERMATKTVPYLQRKQEAVTERIRTSTALSEYIASIAELSTYLKPEELDLVRAEYASLIGTVPTELAIPPAYTQVFKKDAVTVPTVPVEPTPVVSEQPPAEVSEKERQIAAIRQNLGNPDAFTYNPEMALRELFNEDLNTKKGNDVAPYSRAYYSLDRSQVDTVEKLLSWSQSELLGFRNLGPKALEIILEELQKNGILPKTLIAAGEPEVEARKFPKSPIPVEVQLPDGTVRKIVGEAKVETLRALLRAEGNSLSTGELAIKVYGVDIQSARVNINRNIMRLKGDLGSDWEIDQPVKPEERAKGAQAIYTLREDRIIASIAEIQRLSDAGRLTNPLLLVKAQEAARKFDGTIEFTSPPEEELESKVTEQQRKDREELLLLVLEEIMQDRQDLTAREVLQVFGKMKNGRNFGYMAAVNSIYRLVIRLDQKLSLGKADPYEVTILEKIRAYVGSEPDEDAQMVRTKLKEKLIAWFKGERSLTGEEIVRSSSKDTTQQQSGIEVTDSSPKLTERQIARQQEITKRVQGILVELSKIENLPDNMGSSRLTWLAKHNLEVTITDSDIQKFIDRGYIEQFPGNDHHPSYNQKSLLTATYLRRFGNNMSKVQRRELLRIIRREFSAWQAQRSNQ